MGQQKYCESSDAPSDTDSHHFAQLGVLPPQQPPNERDKRGCYQQVVPDRRIENRLRVE